MFLKRISMAGFKSFADKVDLDFSPGLTCVVGPNGCGKSNVVDAFKWVLGEQSAKSLRGGQMLDMIFNGSSSRRSSGMAAVDLLFDNADRSLPLDCDEVTVTRRLYRSGESEYLINKEVSRLKSVRELFLDTGVGSTAYCVIEQGKVDMLLQSSPFERRVVFEEAAGISKYKARKREALRKLERTEQNLLRVADIIEEVDKRLRSVKLQAGKARNWQVCDARLRELRSSFSLAEYHRLTTAIDEHRRRADETSDAVTALRTRIDGDETESVKLTGEADRITAELSATENQIVQNRAATTTETDRIEAATARIGDQQRQAERSAEQMEKLTRRREELAGEQDALQQQLGQLESQIERANAEIASLLASDHELSTDLTRAQAILEDEKAGVIELVRRAADLHNQIVKLETHRESLVGHKGRLSQRDAEIAAELRELMGRKGQLEARRRDVEILIESEMRRLEEKKAQAARIGGLQSELTRELADAKELRSGLDSRRQVLADLERKMEGVGAAVRSVLQAKTSVPDDPTLSCIVGMVADLFEADLVHALVVEAAVGELDQYLVVSDTRAFLAAGERLGELPGRLKVIRLDRLPPLINPRDFAQHPGVIAPAMNFVRFPEHLQQLGRYLLGKTIVVESLDVALTLSAEDADGHRFVTLDGLVVEPDGRIVLGPAERNTGLISRKSELRDIGEQLADLAERITRLEDQLRRTHAEAAHLEEVQQELRGAIHDSHTARVEANAALANIDEAIRRLLQEQPLIAGEVAMLEGQIADAMARHNQNKSSLEQVEAENRRREELIISHKVRIDGVVARRYEVQAALTEAKVRAGQLGEKRSAANQAMLALRRELDSADQQIAAARVELAECQRRIEEAEAAILTGRQRIGELEIVTRRLDAEALSLRRKRELLRSETERLAGDIRQNRHGLEAAESALHGVQMALQEATVRRGELEARVQDELGIALAESYAGYSHTERDWSEVEAEIKELRARMERLGNVNLDAISEQEDLEKRQSFLTSQRDDLADSQNQVQQLIRQLDEECTTRFNETFTAIRDHFRELFRKLFGGGKADIILENPDDILDCGIEILARPPGKELQSISLMSGGEKTMTAIALLMSIFMAKPAPFALLDEVDAALDEANNERFNRILLEFVEHSQFIIITHSKRTMNVADQMYGITMQEPGVSTRVSVKFEGSDSARDESAVA